MAFIYNKHICKYFAHLKSIEKYYFLNILLCDVKYAIKIIYNKKVNTKSHKT